MEEPLFRAIARAAEQRIALKLRTGDAIEPRLITSELLAEFSQILSFDEHRQALQTRIEAHVSKFVARGAKPPV